jgi:hypothetical protein
MSYCNCYRASILLQLHLSNHLIDKHYLEYRVCTSARTEDVENDVCVVDDDHQPVGISETFSFVIENTESELIFSLNIRFYGY